MSSSFSELSSRHLFRLYRFDGSKWPWHWGTYVWDHSNAPLTFSNWHYHEPSLLSKSEALTKDCIDILRGGIWNDRPCSYLNWVICEKSFWTRLPPWWSWRSDFKFQPTLILKKTTVYYYCMFSLIFPQ